MLPSSMNGSPSNIPDITGRSFPSPYSVQSGAGSPGFHHTGTLQGLHNMHGSYNVPNMAGTLPSRNQTINVPPGSMQQSTGNLLTGRFGSNNLPMGLSQIPHVSSHGHSGVTNRGGMNVIGSPVYNSSTNAVGGSIPGVLPTSASIGNRGGVPGIGVSPFLGNAGSQITTSMGNVAGSGSGYIGRSSGGTLSMPGLASRLNLSSNSGSGSLGLQGSNRLMNSGLQQQASPHVMSMLGNSYASGGGPLSQNHAQAVNNLSSMGMLNEVNNNSNSPFGVEDFPLLTSRPNSAGGAHGQIGSIRKQGIGGPASQQNHEFSIQSEDFPALPGQKGKNSEYGMDFHQKDQLRDSSVSMMQNQHFSMGRSSGFTVGGSYPSPRPQQHQQHMPSVSGGSDSFVTVNNQGLQHLHGSDMFSSSNSTYHIQGNGPPDNSMRSMNNLAAMSGVPSYDQKMQQYQQQSPSQFHLRQMSTTDTTFRDQGIKSNQATQAAADKYGLLGLLKIVRMTDLDLSSLALGMDLTMLGLNLNSSEDLHKTFGSPWSDKPVKGDPEFVTPDCYNVESTPSLNHLYFMKFQMETLFYIFYSMPKDEAQLYAANELCRRGWFYHKELRMWLSRFSSVEPLVKTPTYERGSYLSFDPSTWETKKKDNFVLQYDLIEKRPTLHQQ
ncbi:probable NOT transcription complex subunit VIP2 isoform X2 [Chenopodium quinoa]|uniref:probable NOT transcription complex subunit VIP2 isoform X2 n=1 Tax=Chenopodium quinoa TaxID=63459 RepID=UPI000B790378|nr:probable NOT transcription complex subunit VIP2 isoform X2 [Chenopodium quinoa]